LNIRFCILYWKSGRKFDFVTELTLKKRLAWLRLWTLRSADEALANHRG